MKKFKFQLDTVLRYKGQVLDTRLQEHGQVLAQVHRQEDVLEEAQEMSAQQKAKYVHITLDKALRLEKLINEFFEITRYNLQQIVLEKETVNLSFLLEQMTDEFYPILNDHGNTIRLEAREGEGLIAVHGDGEKLARVFNNILKNAITYSYPDT